MTRRWGVLLAALWCASVLGQERMTQFHSDVDIDSRGTLVVTETVRVIAEGTQIKHGIVREFPTDYTDRYGQRVRVPFEVLSVLRNGTPEPWSIERLNNGVRVRIGSAQLVLSPGMYEYQLTYRTARQLGFFDQHDELYWNVTGNDWRLPIERVSAHVQLPAMAGRAQLRAEAYTGRTGARGRDYQMQIDDDAAWFETTRALVPGEGFTLVLMFPKGLVRPLNQWERWWDTLRANPGSVLGVTACMSLWLWLGWRWWRVGRDPQAGPLFPRYDAPAELGPAGVAYLDHMGTTPALLAAALLGLAERGVLRIHQHGSVYRLQRTGVTPAQWWPGEKPLLAFLMGDAQLKELGGAYDPTVRNAQTQLSLALKKYTQPRYFRLNPGSLTVAGLMLVTTLVALLWLDTPALVWVPVIVIMALTCWGFSKILPAYTSAGRALKDHIEGLRLYLSTAERDDLARMQTPPATAQEFARFLPYALALGVEKTWADRFVQVLGTAAVSAAVAHYYTSDNGEWGTMADGMGLGDSLAQLSDTVSAASTPPGSESGGADGSGGGGSSGGGGGGGGGGGW